MSEPGVYANINDITAVGRRLSAEQADAALNLLKTASAKLRLEAKRHGVDLDAMVTGDADYAIVVRSIIVQAVCRGLDSIANTSPAITQGSQSALGYTATYTYVNAGQSLYFLKNELKELGLRKQHCGALEVYNLDTDSQGD
ncbi:MAG: Gp19/Gp15/Gp42 family protein [Oscillospiraceae bacterium]